MSYQQEYFSCYQGIWYKWIDNKWFLSDTPDGSNNVICFNGDIYRIDQCFNIFNEELNKL